jgi:stage II sporulation protein AB (anti-sigma F factor)
LKRSPTSRQPYPNRHQCDRTRIPKQSGEIRIFASLENRSIQVVVQDTGVGIGDIEQARQPFFSTAKDESRSGMGFTVMETFMDEVSIISAPGKGTTIEMRKKIGITG